MHHRRLLLPALALLALGYPCFALVMIHSRGTWPDHWPSQLDALRERAVTYELASMNQENVYEIPFTDRAEFERFWPVLLQVKDKGGTLTLLSPSAQDRSHTLFDLGTPAVRIAAPSGGSVKFRGSEESITMAPPWPDEVYNEDGTLPQYVAWDGERLVGVQSPHGVRRFVHRARVDLTLVVDGSVIDLNRIALSRDTIIVDLRRLPSSQPAEHEQLAEHERAAEQEQPASRPADDDAEVPELLFGDRFTVYAAQSRPE